MKRKKKPSSTNSTHRNHRLPPYKAFRLIAKTADTQWIRMDPPPDNYSCFGHMTAWNKTSLRVTLTYKSGCQEEEEEENKIRLQSTIADHIQQKSKCVDTLFSRANAAYSNAKVIREDEYGLVIVQSNGDCPACANEIPHTVRSIFRDFRCLINDESLYTAIALSGGHLLGTPIDLWDYE